MLSESPKTLNTQIFKQHKNWNIKYFVQIYSFRLILGHRIDSSLVKYNLKQV